MKTIEEPSPKITEPGPVWPPSPLWPGEIVTRKLPLTSSQIFWQIVGRMTKMGLLRGAILGALVGVIFWIIGAVFGLVIGGLAGLVLGFLDGLILGAVTCGCFIPFKSETIYSETIYYATACVLSSLVTFLGGAGIICLLFRPSFTPDDNSWAIAAIPIVIATIAAGEAGLRVAKWYIDEA